MKNYKIKTLQKPEKTKLPKMDVVLKEVLHLLISMDSISEKDSSEAEIIGDNGIWYKKFLLVSSKRKMVLDEILKKWQGISERVFFN